MMKNAPALTSGKKPSSCSPNLGTVYSFLYYIKSALIRCLCALFLFFSVAGAQSVAVFIPNDLFRDDEFEPVVRVLERSGFEVVVVSNETTAAQGFDGLLVKPQRLYQKIRPEEFAALVLIDGSGLVPYLEDSVLHQLCREFVASNRIVAGIELAPLAFAYAGILRGKTATVFPDHYSIRILKENGCRHTFKSVVVDGNIITAARAENAVALARTLVKKLKRR